MTVALVCLLVGGVLLYAGITGRSVTSLLRGDSTAAAPNTKLGG